MSTLTNTFKSIGNARTGIMLLVAIAMVGGFIVLGLRASTGNMAPLYTGLALEDSSKIIAELEKSGTPYEILGNGSEILVPNDRVLRLRMNMATMGIPATGSVVGYEIFDRSETLGSSNLVMNINMLRALEGELARTISSISNVDAARVHLVMPKHEMFTRDKDKPSASITIKMRGGHILENAEVNAVTHLVAAAVPGLEPSKVTVVDSNGRLLARGDGDIEGTAAANNALEYRVAFETRTQKDLEDMLEKIVGSGKARVQVSADINFDRLVTNSEKFDPDGQVARSIQSNSERDNSQDKAASDNVSAAAKLPAGAGAESGNSSNHLAEHSNETTNYEISKTVQNHISQGGDLKKLSVAVLVDGTYTTGTDGKSAYAPRSDEELKKLRLLIASAVGFDDKRGDKIEVVNMPFNQDNSAPPSESFFEKFKIEMQSIMQTLIIAIVAILAIVLVLRPAVNQLVAQSQSASTRVSAELANMQTQQPGRLPSNNPSQGGGNNSQEEESGFDTDALIDVANIKGGMKASTMQKMNDIIDQHPEETMSVLRKWVGAPT